MRMMLPAMVAAAFIVAAPAAAQDNVTIDNNVAVTEPANEVAPVTDPLVTEPVTTPVAPIETAPAPATQERARFPWGLLGLIGLAGLIGRRRAT